MGKFFKTLVTVLFIIGTTAWGVLALYLGDSHTDVFQTFLAIAFGLFGLLTLGCLALPFWRKPLLISYLLLFVAILTGWLLIEPANDRHWQADIAKLSFASIDGDNITVHNIRNFNYRSEFDFQPAYYTKTFDLKKLQGVDMAAVYWMGPAIAHTILIFNFGDKDHLAVSIEARKEQNEGYSTIKGFFRQFELVYIVADERDVLRLRTNYRKDPPEEVYLYRLQGSPKVAQNLFLEYIKKINGLYEKPEFYNTLLDNCTTSIWFNTRVNPEHLPFSWKILLSGYVPEYLYESGRLNTQIPFVELQRQAHINARAQAADQAADFSTRIRTTVEKP